MAGGSAAHLPQEPHHRRRRLPPATLGGATLNGDAPLRYADVLGVDPAFDAQPRSFEEIAEAVGWADGAGKAVIPWGGGGGQSYGYAPSRADILLDLTRLNRILAIEPGDLTITVEAGATLASVQDALAAHGQYLPITVPDAETATLGGILATAAAPAARDYLIGIAVVDAQGRLVRGGGKVVKNVTGYDIPKMHLGALGTLGIIVEATFKVAPLPESTQTLSFTKVSEPFLHCLHKETQPKGSRLTRTPTAETLAVTYSGIAEVVADDAAKAQTIARETGATETENTEARSQKSEVRSLLALLLSGLPHDAAARHAALWEMNLWQSVATEPITGAVTVQIREGTDSETALRAALAWANANPVKVAVLDAPLELRQGDFPLWHPLPPALPLMRRLKQTLDPNATLNPGRFLDRL